MIEAAATVVIALGPHFGLATAAFIGFLYGHCETGKDGMFLVSHRKRPRCGLVSAACVRSFHGQYGFDEVGRDLNSIVRHKRAYCGLATAVCEGWAHVLYILDRDARFRNADHLKRPDCGLVSAACMGCFVHAQYGV